MNNWFETLNGTQDMVWDRLCTSADNNALVALGTISVDGLPEVRTVVLRHADRATRTLEIYTDLQSDKITSLRAHPNASILLWDDATSLQIRVQAKVAILSGPQVLDRWAAVPDHSKISYGITPAPGQIIPDSTAYTKTPNADVFAVLSCEATHIDAVYLGDIHRRAAFSQVGDWAGNWLAP
ncbi:pyridoxine/pyridoxamine 5'-phosphate oxidase [Loktanella ponticola]|uniref:Pyridoxine/pyridoxamine 5'-phosphate oxidase n=1 Tax=Yoonia ponticola TaxID=1524255 RepID=A0A7W9BHF3_9RHOB|nr:pyridoxamine 5'-phosphate oxidase family protein [Yoonia ponticola]MBB5720597.1 pyridoxine/pyridoxamine 5'-phosphate oxidase [Yoonia ponticola]